MNPFARFAALMAPTPSPELEVAKRLLEEAEVSHDELRRSLQAAVKASRPLAAAPGYYCWIRDVFDDRVIYEEETPSGTTLFEQSYAVSETGVVTLTGEPAAVRVQTVYVAVTEASESGARDLDLAGDTVPLLEKAVRKDGTIPLRIIAPGWGSSGYYSEALLKRDGPKAFPKGTHMYWDHPTSTEARERPERSVTELAAVTTSAPVYKEHGPAGPGLYADAQVLKPYQEAIEELAPHIGVSIRAAGHAKSGVAEGRKGPVIESIVAGGSIDFVTQAGAGGQVLQLFEAARGRTDGGETVSEQELQEARAAAEAAQRERDEARQEAARLREAAVLREAREVAADALSKAEVPNITRDRLLEQLAKNPPSKDGALDRPAFEASIAESVKAEAEYLAKVTGSGRIHGMGAAGGSQSALEESEQRLTAALGRGFGLTESGAKIAAGGRSH